MIKSKYLWTILVALLPAGARAQESSITIEACYELAKQNYPLAGKQALIAESGQLSVANANKTYLPQLSVNGQATYQSTTISFPDALMSAPGVALPELSKDQYKIQAELSQQLYDGGATGSRKAMLRSATAIQQQALEVSLYALRDRITQLYFAILLINEQAMLNETRKATLQSAADRAAAALQNGTSFKSNVDELQAEVAHAEMTNIELRSARKAYLEMLSRFTGKKIDEQTKLVKPEEPSYEAVIKRPELTLYELQKKDYDAQEKQLRSTCLPKLNAFIQGAYGRPTLNIIENDFGAWWIGGLRLSWNISSFYTLKTASNIFRLNQQSLDADKETFVYNTHIMLSQQNGDIQKYTELLRQDDTIITLRASVAKAAQAQLDNGAVTVHDYISKLNAETTARQTRIVHAIQLLQSQYNYKNTSGN